MNICNCNEKKNKKNELKINNYNVEYKVNFDGEIFSGGKGKIIAESDIYQNCYIVEFCDTLSNGTTVTRKEIIDKKYLSFL